MNAPLMNPEWSQVSSMNYDGFDERPFLVFWEITRACALSCKHCRAEAQSHRHPDELNREESSHLIQLRAGAGWMIRMSKAVTIWTNYPELIQPFPKWFSSSHLH